MGTSWNLRCVTCSVNLLDEFERYPGPQELVSLIRNSEAVASLADLFADCPGEFELRSSYNTVSRPIDPVVFRAHLGHQLMPIDEYGRLLDACHQKFQCPHCATWHPCSLSHHHEGPHSYVKPLAQP